MKDEVSLSLRDRVLARLGFAGPPSLDLAGLRALYAAWCANVPFDNVRKMIALRTGARLPGQTADDFFEHWLEHGTGGTCWATSNALYALLSAAGFDVERAAGSMADRGVANHGTVRARAAGQTWLVDSSMLTNVPLPLGDRLFLGGDPILPVEIEPTEDGAHRVWWTFPQRDGLFPCRLFAGEASHALYLERYEVSREQSGFNERLYARRNQPGGSVVFYGRTRYERTAAGIESRECSPDELLRCLREEIGLSESVVEVWVDCGGLEDSLKPPEGPAPPSIAMLPPSQRIGAPET